MERGKRAHLPDVGMRERELAARERQAPSVATGRDDEPVRLEDLAVGTLNGVRADEPDRPATGDQRHAGSREMPDELLLLLQLVHGALGRGEQRSPGPRSPAPLRRAKPIGRQLLDVAKQPGRLCEHARGRTTVVRARATRSVALHERHARPELRRTQRRRGAGGTPADDDQVEAFHPRSVPRPQAAVGTLPAASMYTAASSTPSTPSISLIASSMNAPMPHAPSPIDVAARYAFSPT